MALYRRFAKAGLLQAQCTRAAGVHPHGGVVSANLPRKHVVKVRKQPSPQWERGVANTFAGLFANFNHIFIFFAAIAWGVMRSLQHPLAGLTGPGPPPRNRECDILRLRLWLAEHPSCVYPIAYTAALFHAVGVATGNVPSDTTIGAYAGILFKAVATTKKPIPNVRKKKAAVAAAAVAAAAVVVVAAAAAVVVQ